jgi:aspartate kinase
MMLTSDGESLDSLMRTLEKGAGLRKLRETLSSVTLTCFGGVSSDLCYRAMQVLSHHRIVADKYVMSPHSLSFVVEPKNREAAVRALHSMV